MINSVTKHLNPELIILMPTHIPPHKEVTTSTHHRCQMLKNWCDKYTNYPCKVSDYESSKSSPSYTYETLDFLSSTYDNLYLLIGSDNFFSFHTWKHPQYILKNVRLVIVPRDESEESDYSKYWQSHFKEFSKNSYIVLPDPLMPVSSTLIREKRDLSLVPEAVKEYIQDHNIYRGYP